MNTLLSHPTPPGDHDGADQGQDSDKKNDDDDDDDDDASVPVY